MATIEPRLIHLLNNTRTPNLPPLQLSPFDNGTGSISLPPLEPDPGYRSDHPSATQIPPLLPVGDDPLAKQAPRTTDNAFSSDTPVRVIKAVPSLQQLLGDIEPPSSSLPLRMLVDDTPDFQDDPSTKKRHRGMVQKDDFMQLPQPLKKQKSTQQVVPPIIAGLHEPPPDPGVFPPINTTGSNGATLFGDFCNMEDDRATALGGANASDSGEKSSGTTKGKRRATKPRKKWSEEETNHLLLGVNRYGVGKWTSILEDTDFKFNGRTAGDLKDRFRTCCPDELRGPSASTGRRQRTGKNGTVSIFTNRYGQPDYAPANDDTNLYHNGTLPKPGKTSLPLENILIEPESATTTAATTPLPIAPTITAGPTAPSSGQALRQRTERELLHPLPEESVPFVIGRHRKSRAHRKKMEDLAELGIHAPFKKSHRRERRPFTEQDDQSILAGLREYGPAWTKIQRDRKFDLLSRQPTDLRDRVRNKYPEIYSNIEKGTPLFGPKSKSGRGGRESRSRKLGESGISKDGEGGQAGGATDEHQGDSSKQKIGEGGEEDKDGDVGEKSAGEVEKAKAGGDSPGMEMGGGRRDRSEEGGGKRRAHGAATNGPLLEPAANTTIDKVFQQQVAAQELNRSSSREQLIAMVDVQGGKGEQLVPLVSFYEPVSASLPGFADVFDVPMGLGLAGGGGGTTGGSLLSPGEMDIGRLLLDDASASGVGRGGPRAGEYHSHPPSHSPHHQRHPPQRRTPPLPLPHHMRYGGVPGPTPGQGYDHSVGK